MNSLLATLVICMGMSNGMPVSDYNKKQINHESKTEIQPKYASSEETQVNTYEITTTLTNVHQSQSGNYYREKANINNGNAYLNILGNMYLQSYTQVNAGYGTTYGAIANLSIIGNGNQDVTNWETNKLAYMLQITPYNYNVDTTIWLECGYYIIGNAGTTNLATRTRIYTSNDNNWQEYLDLQITSHQVTEIETAITNVNNNYYYDLKTRTTYHETTQLQWTAKSETFEINITPNTNNYIFIVIEPMAIFNDTEIFPNIWELLEIDKNMKTAIWTGSGGLKVSGTNIIPPSSYEVIDLPGLMFEVLGMPFSFISQAFSLTLFPGTPYQINLSNLFLAIIAVMIFIFLIKLLLLVINRAI